MIVYLWDTFKPSITCHDPLFRYKVVSPYDIGQLNTEQFIGERFGQKPIIINVWSRKENSEHFKLLSKLNPNDGDLIYFFNAEMNLIRYLEPSDPSKQCEKVCINLHGTQVAGLDIKIPHARLIHPDSILGSRMLSLVAGANRRIGKLLSNKNPESLKELRDKFSSIRRAIPFLNDI